MESRRQRFDWGFDRLPFSLKAGLQGRYWAPAGCAEEVAALVGCHILTHAQPCSLTRREAGDRLPSARAGGDGNSTPLRCPTGVPRRHDWTSSGNPRGPFRSDAGYARRRKLDLGGRVAGEERNAA